MKNIYNKGRYRFGEYGHLRPYLKRQGNKLWRRTVDQAIEDQLTDCYKKLKSKKTPKIIKVKITQKSFNDSTISYTQKYRTLKDVKNAINRNTVVRYHIFNPSEK